MKKQLMKLAGASILAFSLSFVAFMTLTISMQEQEQPSTIQAIQESNTTLASVLH